MEMLDFGWLLSPSRLFSDDFSDAGEQVNGGSPASAPRPAVEDVLVGHAADAAPTIGGGEQWQQQRQQQDARFANVQGYREQDDPIVAAADAGPMWHFIYSRYALSLVIIGVLSNRIQHVCRPRSRPQRLTEWKRLLVRLPALLALAYVTARQGTRTLELWNASSGGGGWVVKRGLGMLPRVLRGSGPALAQQLRSDKDLMWMTHLAACLSVATDTLTRTLEGQSEPAPSFNLVGFALTVQAHSSVPSLTSNVNFFLFIFLQIAEVFCLFLMATFRHPPLVLRRLGITTFFGVVGILHWVVAQAGSGGLPRPFASSTLFFVGFDRFPEICLMAVIALTVALHALTMLLTEGSDNRRGADGGNGGSRIDWGRLVFSSSNLPGRDDDFSLALFKLGTACLQSTRQSGLSREMVAIEVPERTYVEVDDDASGSGGWGARVRVGLDGLIKGPQAEGMHNEIRLTVPREGGRSAPTEGGVGGNDGGYKGPPNYQSALLMSTSKWQELKRFIFSLYLVLASLLSAAYRRLIAPCLPPCPAWVRKVPRWARLAWHGQNGETKRELRLETQRVEAKLKKAKRDTALRALLERNGVRVSRGEDVTEVAWRVMRERNADVGAVAEASGTSSPTAEDMGIDPRLWNYLRNSQRGAAQGVAGDEDEEDDEDWSEDIDDEDAESVTSYGDDDDHSRSRSRSRSVFSPTPTPEDAQDPDESLSLLQLARMDFNNASEEPDDEDFSQVLLAHVSSRDEVPLTRSRYRALLGPAAAQPSAFASTSSPSSALIGPSSSSSTVHAESSRLRDVLLQRRRPYPPRTDDADEEERSRRRLCVVCCYEERTVLFWPCRCLALCDGCREELASRPGAKGDRGAGEGGVGGMHHCPTCRSTVKGWSRIFLP